MDFSSVNKITSITFACFFTAFVALFLGNILEKIFEFFLIKKKIHTILLRIMLKIWQKNSFSKKFKSIHNTSNCLKASVIVFNECFC
jgi:hypothetical protein